VKGKHDKNKEKKNLKHGVLRGRQAFEGTVKKRWGIISLLTNSGPEKRKTKEGGRSRMGSINLWIRKGKGCRKGNPREKNSQTDGLGQKTTNISKKREREERCWGRRSEKRDCGGNGVKGKALLSQRNKTTTKTRT